MTSRLSDPISEKHSEKGFGMNTSKISIIRLGLLLLTLVVLGLSASTTLMTSHTVPSTDYLVENDYDTGGG